MAKNTILLFQPFINRALVRLTSIKNGILLISPLAFDLFSPIYVSRDLHAHTFLQTYKPGETIHRKPLVDTHVYLTLLPIRKALTTLTLTDMSISFLHHYVFIVRYPISPGRINFLNRPLRVNSLREQEYESKLS